MSTKRARIVITLCLLLTFIAAGGVQAQGPEAGPCYVVPFGPSEVTFNRSECSSIFLGTMEWYALSPGLVNAFIKDLQFSISAEGPGLDLAMDPTETATFWSPITELPPEVTHVTCPQRENLWGSIWMRDLGSLAPGSYSVHAELILQHPVTDAVQRCSWEDGTPLDHYVYRDWDWVNEIALTILDQ